MSYEKLTDEALLIKLKKQATKARNSLYELRELQSLVAEGKKRKLDVTQQDTLATELSKLKDEKTVAAGGASAPTSVQVQPTTLEDQLQRQKLQKDWEAATAKRKELQKIRKKASELHQKNPSEDNAEALKKAWSDELAKQKVCNELKKALEAIQVGQKAVVKAPEEAADQEAAQKLDQVGESTSLEAGGESGDGASLAGDYDSGF